MHNEPKHGGWATLIAAKIVCCGILLLFLTGAVTLGGITAWLGDGNLAWLALAVGAAMAWFFLRLRGKARARVSNQQMRQSEIKGN